MLKKLLYILLIIVFGLVSPALSADFKISEVKTDNSQNIIVLDGNISSNYVNYSTGFSQNPLRAYIDLDDAIFLGNKKTIELKNNPIKKVVIAQFSTRPNKVRLVFHADSMEALKNIKLIKNGKSLTFKLNDFTIS